MKKEFKIFLTKNNYLPILGKKWNKFKITHYKIDVPKDRKKDDHKEIREKFGDKAGIYCYKKGDKIIYIGQSKNLKDRIRGHYQIAFEEKKNDPKNKWHKFFKKNSGNLKILWKQINNRFERIAIEHMLKVVKKPKFDEEHSLIDAD